MILAALSDLAPLTWTPAFIEAPFEDSLRNLLEWREEIHHSPEARRVSSLREGLEGLPPLDGKRELLMKTANERWVAYFHGGLSPEGTAAVLGERLAARGVLIDISPRNISADRKTGSWGGTRFEIRGPGGAYGRYLCSLAAINDGGRWTWDSSGDPFPFEELDQYALKRVQDRLRPDMVERYCAALGIRLNDPSFYGTEGVLVENAGFVTSPYVRTLAEARADLRLDEPPRQRGRVRVGHEDPARQPPDGRRFVEEWRGSADLPSTLADNFRRQSDLLTKAGVAIDSMNLNYEDGEGTWEIVATITIDQAKAIGYDHEKLLWLETQETFD